MFDVLVNPAVFSQMSVEEWGHGLDWPGGLDMGADSLYQLCREQAGLFSPVAFDGWIKRISLSLSTAADALGMTRRMIAHYRSGSRPIPKTVQLACIGWESLKKASQEKWNGFILAHSVKHERFRNTLSLFFNFGIVVIPSSYK